MKKWNSSQKNWAFTLAEIVIAVAIVSIISIWVANINFSRLSVKEKVAIETNKVKSIIETARNNALIGRWVGTNLETPEYWELEFDANNNTIKSSYFTGSLQTFENHQIPNTQEIAELRCYNIDRSNSATWTIMKLEVKWPKMEIKNGCSPTNGQIIELDIASATEQETITINALSGIIE